MARSPVPVVVPRGKYVTATFLERCGWSRTQIAAVLGRADARLDVGSGVTVSLFSTDRIVSIVDNADLKSTPQTLKAAREGMEKTLTVMLDADIPISNEVNDGLPHQIHNHLRKRYSDYRNLSPEGKHRNILSHLRHKYTAYDEVWRDHYIRLPLAGILHDAYRMRVHQLLAQRCPSFADAINAVNVVMDRRVQRVLNEVWEHTP